jgi:hypothetical protein
MLVDAFKPRNIFPCTVDEKGWSIRSSMFSLFGHLYEKLPVFTHDEMMRRKKGLNTEPAKVISRPGSSGSNSSHYATPDDGASKHGSKTSPATLAEQAAHLHAPQPAAEDCHAETNGKGTQASPIDVEQSSKADVAAQRAPHAGLKHPTGAQRDLSRPSSSKDARTARPSSPLLSNINSSSQTIGDPADLVDTSLDPRNVAKRRRLSTSHITVRDPKRTKTPTSAWSKSDRGHSMIANFANHVTMAFRKEAFDAAAGWTNVTWSDINLVSVRGHQEKEMEL